jgi:hypothetical protein
VHTTISGLSTGSHILRIIPVDGTIAIDGFAVEGLAPLPEPTITPTVESTLQPTVEPTLDATIAPTATPTPLVIPFTETFSSDQTWTASGAWLFDTESWFASSDTRGESLTLTSNAAIDLRMAFYPRLSFVQRGELSAYDTLAVEVSVDGGLSWAVVDQQTGLTSEDWQTREVDLSAFAGQLITLRFRLDATQPLPDGVTSIGAWIDTLTLQEVPPTLTPEIIPPTAVPTDVIPVNPTEIVPTAEPPVATEELLATQAAE